VEGGGVGGGGGATEVRFVSGVKETLVVNVTPRQTVLRCSALPSSLTGHITPEFPKYSRFMIGQRWKHIVKKEDEDKV